MHFPPQAITHLAAFSAPIEQAVHVGKFIECHDILLSHSPLAIDWDKVKEHISLHNGGNTLSSNSIITRECLAVDEFQQPNWPAVYLLSMVWGFGETNGRPAKDGPAKLFVSTQTPQAAQRINNAAGRVLAGDLAGAFDSLCVIDGASKLSEIGPSFGTKFLFAVGMHLALFLPTQNPIRPLVYDARIKKALDKLFASFQANMPAQDFLWMDVKEGVHYEAYCACISESATLMNRNSRAVHVHWDAYKLEQLLFEQAGNIA